MTKKKTPSKKKVVKKTTKKVTAKKIEKISELETLMRKLKPAMIRFVYLFLGSEDGRGFNNATISYLIAYDINTTTRKVKNDEGKEDYTPQYKSAKTKGYQLLTKGDIQKLKSLILLESGFTPDTVKKRFSELAYQNKNLPVAQGSIRDIAKITGVMKEESKQVDIPQLTELTDQIKQILNPS